MRVAVTICKMLLVTVGFLTGNEYWETAYGVWRRDYRSCVWCVTCSVHRHANWCTPWGSGYNCHVRELFVTCCFRLCPKACYWCFWIILSFNRPLELEQTGHVLCSFSNPQGGVAVIGVSCWNMKRNQTTSLVSAKERARDPGRHYCLNKVILNWISSSRDSLKKLCSVTILPWLVSSCTSQLHL